ncbi:MAG: hypothetical protein ACQEQA_03275 [Bacillota bacterium]
MKNFVTKNPILNIVLGIILVGLALTAMFFTTWLEDAIVYIIAGLIIIVSIYRFYLDLKRTTDKNATIILVVELLIALGIGIYLMVEAANASRMVGFVLYLRGFTYLLTLQLLKISGSFKKFLIIIALMTLGAYMLFSGIQGEAYLQYGVFGIVTLYGLLLVFAGIQILQARPSKEKPQKVDTQSEKSEATQEPPKEEPSKKDTSNTK